MPPPSVSAGEEEIKGKINLLILKAGHVLLSHPLVRMLHSHIYLLDYVSSYHYRYALLLALSFVLAVTFCLLATLSIFL